MPKTTMTVNGLYDNCHKAWPNAQCGFGNVCGDISDIIWFVVLVPQIWKNWKRRSVEGLSILWASANFTGSLVNGFFVFSNSLPLYIKISAVYLPILEFSILVQFWFYSKHSVKMKVLYGMGCFLVWIAVIIVELSVENAAPDVQWIAIVLWSAESFPQVILNMHLRKTSGQSTPSVVIGVIGKTTDFLSNYLLRLPPQYVIMTYFSSTLVYINGVQVIWYLKPQLKNTTMIHPTYGGNRALNEEPLEVDDCDECSLIGDPEGSVEADRASEEKMASVCTQVIPTTDFSARIRGIPSYQRLFAVYLCLAVAVFSVCVCLNTPSNWGIFAPPVVFVVLLCALLYRNYREGRMHC